MNNEKGGGKAATTPQALRDQAERAIRLALGLLDAPAKEALLVHAQELQQKAAELEAAPDTTTTTKPPDGGDSNR